jgi:PTS system mannitol-specific IIC component
MFLLKFFGKDDLSLENAQKLSKTKKAESKGEISAAVASFEESEELNATAQNSVDLEKRDIKKIVFACDAGMGSSAMGATKLKKKIQNAGVTDVSVSHSPVSDVPSDADLIICHQELSERAKNANPNALVISITDFLNAPEYEEVIKMLKK